jgi:hypothetical protein
MTLETSPNFLKALPMNASVVMHMQHGLSVNTVQHSSSALPTALLLNENRPEPTLPHYECLPACHRLLQSALTTW